MAFFKSLLPQNIFKVLLLTSVLTVLAPAILLADPTLLDDKFSQAQKDAFEEVQGNIMSPYCPGRLLKDCPSTAARDLKKEIKEKILAGSSAKEIEQELIQKFGDDMRAAPELAGIGMLAWLMPIVFLCIGGVVISIWVLRQAKQP